MKRKIFVFALTLIFGIINVCAEDAVRQNVYLQDFSITTDVSAYVSPAQNNSFSASADSGALDMKTDSLCFFRATAPFAGITEANSANNSRGITYYNKNYHTGYKLDEPQDIVHTDKKTYTVYYKVEAGGSNALLLDEMEGLTAIGFHTFNNQDRKDKPVNTTDVKFNVAPGLFSKDDNAVTFRFRIYAGQANAPLNMTYIRPNGSQSSRTLFKFTEEEVGKWITKDVSLTDIDLTALITQDSGAAMQQYAFRMNTALGYDLYLHSIEIIKDEAVINPSAGNNTYEVKINENPLYGDVDFSYDMVIPSGVSCYDDVCGDSCVAPMEYNSGKNRMTVNLLNTYKDELATVVYDLEGTVATVSLEYTDEGGNNALKEVFSGDIADRNLTYTVSYDMLDGANTFSIYDGDVLVASTDAPLGIKNRADTANTFVQYYSICQNQSSRALYARVDNISVMLLENTVYKSFVEDIESIELPDIVRDDFTLPSTGAMNGNSITWESVNADIISVNGYDATIYQDAEENKKAILTATISDGMFSVSADFEVTVKALKGEYSDRFEIIEEVSGDSTIAKTTLKNAGRSGAKKVYFVAVSYKNGAIIDRAVCERDVVSEYDILDFELSVKTGNNIKYYLWDENTVPLVNHAPHIYKAGFENKVLGAVIKWEKAYDDFRAVETYRIERSDGKVFITDGEECGDNMLRFFDREADANNTYTYTLTAADTNQKVSESISGKAKKVNMPYSMDVTPTFSADGTHDGGNHIGFIYRSDPDRAAYTEHGIYNDTEECTFIPSGKYAAFITDLADITENIAVRFTYASPVDTKLKFMYNGKQPDGSFAEVSETVKAYPATDGWQTVDFKLEKEFRAGNTFTGGLFGLGCASPGGVYLKKVEFVKLEDYE